MTEPLSSDRDLYESVRAPVPLCEHASEPEEQRLLGAEDVEEDEIAVVHAEDDGAPTKSRGCRPARQAARRRARPGCWVGVAHRVYWTLQQADDSCLRLLRRPP